MSSAGVHELGFSPKHPHTKIEALGGIAMLLPTTHRPYDYNELL
jgi:hypothetical protein